jgi:uncharacterized protein (DUF1697 family)
MRAARHHGTVTTYIALLRGINLGRSRRVAMADLRGWLTELGYTDVHTHLQSGNAVFASDEPAGEVTRQIEKRLEAGTGFPVGCVVRTAAQLRRIVAGNPFEDFAADGARLQVAFLSAPLDPARLADVDPAAVAPERFHAAKTEIYLWYPNGIQKSKLNGLLTDKRLGVSATARNWNTVTKLLEIAGG